VYAGPIDWVFASGKEKGRIPRAGNMLVSDHLRPAPIKAGVLRVAEDSRVYDSSGSPVKRFGVHNLSGPAIKGAIMAGSSRSQWSTPESPRSTETQ
jgi:hypothetical protein